MQCKAAQSRLLLWKWATSSNAGGVRARMPANLAALYGCRARFVLRRDIDSRSMFGGLR